jgi:hypothetical protein
MLLKKMLTLQLSLPFLLSCICVCDFLAVFWVRRGLQCLIWYLICAHWTFWEFWESINTVIILFYIDSDPHRRRRSIRIVQKCTFISISTMNMTYKTDVSVVHSMWRQQLREESQQQIKNDAGVVV